MEEDLANLVRRLLTRAGMIMEDASAIAIQIGHKTPDELGSICGLLRAHNRDVDALLAAADTLIKPDFPES